MRRYFSMSGQNLVKKFYTNVQTFPIKSSELNSFMSDAPDTKLFTIKIDSRQVKTPDRNT
jgi:hypothetical protein